MERIGRYRYFIMTMIVLMVVVNYIDRGAISYAAKPITGEYHFSDSAWGAMLGYFGYGYMVGALIGGALADRMGPRFVWILFGTLWSIFEVCTAFAGDFGLAVLGGVGPRWVRRRTHPVRVLRGADLLHHQPDHGQLGGPA